MIILLIAFIATQTTAQQRLPSPEFEPCEPYNPPIYTDSIHQGGGVANLPKINLKPPKAIFTQGDGEGKIETAKSPPNNLDENKGLTYVLAIGVLGVCGTLIKDLMDRGKETAQTLVLAKDSILAMSTVLQQCLESAKEHTLITKGLSREITIALEKLANLQKDLDEVKNDLEKVKNKVAHI